MSGQRRMPDLPVDVPHRRFTIWTPYFAVRGLLVKPGDEWIVFKVERLQSLEGLTASEIKAKCDSMGWRIESEKAEN